MKKTGVSGRTIRGRLAKTASVFLVLVLLSSLLPCMTLPAYAAGEVGKLNDTSYTSFSSLVNDLKNNYKNKTVTIQMSDDWDAAKNSVFDKQLVIPGGCRATLDMQGHLFSRNRSGSNKWENNGELIRVEDKATLTINGGDRTHHTVKVYNSSDRSKKADASYNAEGGTLAGGASTNGGGGIHVKSDATLTMNSVTIAGCRAEQKSLSDGYGGGLRIAGKNTNVRINDSVITGCFAYNDGGGIHADSKSNIRIEVNNSHIDGNFAHNKGGGFNTDGKNIYLAGDGRSTISNNKCEDVGGGVSIRKGNSSVSGFTISGNKARTGGGVCIDGQSVSLSGLIVKNNTASERGGGIFINSDHNTVSSCEVTDNSAGSYGGGVCVAAGVKDEFAVTGSTIIRNNRKGNLFIADTNPENSRVMFSLTRGSDVHMSYSDTKGKTSIMVTPGKAGDTIKNPDCIQFLTADNSGYHFTFNEKPNQRKIYYVKDDRDSDATGKPLPDQEDPTGVTPAKANDASGKEGDRDTAAGIVGKTGAGGRSKGGEYDLIRGFFHHQRTDSDTEDADAVFYYSDAFFFDIGSYEYNENLAAASLTMAFAGCYLRAFEDKDSNGNDYYNKHAGGRQFLADIGCPDQNIYVNDNMVKKPGTDSIGVTIGSKPLKKSGDVDTGYTLVPIVVRGAGYEAEWASNMTLGEAEEGSGNEAQGFSEAADNVTGEVEDYISRYDLEDELKEGKVKFWITGFSRAGATANLTAKRLVEMYVHNPDYGTNEVFAYPCEAPKGGTDNAEKLADEEYFCIHNLVNAVDVVPLVGPEGMGFKRYGVDHYIPGSPAFEGDYTAAVKQYGKTEKHVSGAGRYGAGTVTTYRDNDPLYIKGGGQPQYHNNAGTPSGKTKEAMKAQLRTIDPDIIFDDYFHPMAMDFVPGLKMYENGDYDGNHTEELVSDFVRFMQEGILPDDSTADWSKAVESRDKYVSDLQTALRDTMSLVFSMSSEDTAGFTGRASTIMDKISVVTFSNDVSMLDIYLDVINSWHALSDDQKKRYTTFLWDKVEQSGAFDYLSESDQAKLEKNWPYLADFIFTLVEADYHYTPKKYSYSKGWAKGSDKTMMFVPSFATYANYILLNHYPEVDLAWARVYETNNYYENETKEYEVMTDGYEVNMPKAAAAPPDSAPGTDISKGSELDEWNSTKKNNVLVGDQRIILEVDDIVGEAIYYDLIDNKTEAELESNRIYRGGIDLSLGKDPERDYTIRTYAMSYGVKSKTAVYNIRLTSDRHNVTVDDGSGADPETYIYREGNSETITAKPSADKYFEKWKISLLDGNGTTIKEDIGDSLLEDDIFSESAVFVMPEAGKEYGSGEKYPAGYALEVIAICKPRINRIESSPSAPQEGAALQEKVAVTLTAAGVSWTPADESGNAIEYPVIWARTYEKDGKTITVPASGKAYNNSEYTATITIPKDAESGILFNPTGELDGTTSSGGTVKSVTRNDADGSATIEIAFPKTGSEGGEEPPEADIILTVKVYDLSLRDYYDSKSVDYHVVQDSEVMLTAPDVEDESFAKWNLEGSVVTLADGYSESDKTVKVVIPKSLSVDQLTIDAQYTPVIREITAALDVPEGGEAMQTLASDEAGKETLKAVIGGNEYLISPEYVSINWTPEPLSEEGSDKKTAEFLTPYTATLTIDPKKDQDGNDYIAVRKDGDPGYTKVAPVFIYAENLTATVNGENAHCDKTGNSISYTFPMTKYTYDYAEQPGTTVYLSYGASDKEIRSQMPKQATIVTKEGRRFVVELGDDSEINDLIPQKDNRDGRVLVVSQAVSLPDGVDNPAGYDTHVMVIVSVDEAEHASSPESTLESGTYLYDQQTTLVTTEKGGTTYYTTDGSDPSVSSTRKVYDGETIYISRGDSDEVILKAYTVKDGKWDSAVVTYEYVFGNEVPVPESEELVYNAEPQTGVQGSPFYTLTAAEGSGVTIDDEGNATATDAGTYTVTAKIKDGFRWTTGDGDDTATTTDDQQISFTISPVMISDAAKISAKGTFRTLNDLKKALSVVPTGELKPEEGRDYEISYGKVKGGKVTVTVTGKGNYAGTISGTFIIDPDKKVYTITLDLNGGELDGVTGTITEQYEEGTVITMPKPEKEGCTFLYWKGSEYHAGDRYKVTEDHTFAAQWEKSTEKGDHGDGESGSTDTRGQSEKSGSARTGDSVRILEWTALFLASLLALLIFVLRKNKDRI